MCVHAHTHAYTHIHTHTRTYFNMTFINGIRYLTVCGISENRSDFIMLLSVTEEVSMLH